MKKCICAILAVLVVLQPMISLADGGYHLLKTIMGMQLLSDVEVPESDDYSHVSHEMENRCICMVQLPNQWIAISGRNLSENYESLMYNNLTVEQFVVYSMAICVGYAEIDAARTTSTAFLIAMKYGDGDDEMVIIDNAEDAEKVAKIISDALD